METAQNLTVGKNELWTAYQNADPLVFKEILLELQKKNLYRHFQRVASREGYNLKGKANHHLRDIFIRLIPETAPLFGVQNNG